MKIQVNAVKSGEYDVTLQDQSETRHRVRVDPSYYESLTHGKISVEELLQRSFAFLLQRESQGMILSQFDLPVIQSYFPDYEATIKRDIQ